MKSSMNAFLNIFTSQKSKPPIQITTLKKNQTFFQIFDRIRFMPFSCRFHAVFKHIYIYAEFMSDSCQIQLISVLPFINIALCRFHAGFMHIYIYAEFMSDSCQIQLISVLPFIHIAPYCIMSFSCRFHAYLHLCRIHAGFS